MSARNINQRLMNVFGHALGIAANVKVRAGLKPRPELGRVLLHAGLHIDFFGLITTKRQVEAIELAGFLPAREFLAVKEIGGEMLLAEEEPFAAFGAVKDAL